ncbi:hypothetical protein D3C71_1933180 [compost metagenome]
MPNSGLTFVAMALAAQSKMTFLYPKNTNNVLRLIAQVHTLEFDGSNGSYVD